MEEAPDDARGARTEGFLLGRPCYATTPRRPPGAATPKRPPAVRAETPAPRVSRASSTSGPARRECRTTQRGASCLATLTGSKERVLDYGERGETGIQYTSMSPSLKPSATSMLRPSCAPNWTLGDCMPEASIAQDPVVGGCGSSLDSRFRIRGQTPVF